MEIFLRRTIPGKYQRTLYLELEENAEDLKKLLQLFEFCTIIYTEQAIPIVL